MTLRTALRTSSNRAAVQLLNTRRDQERRQLRGEAERRHAAERAVAGARRERRDARAADGRLRRLRQRRRRARADADPARRGRATARCSTRRPQVAPGGQRDDGLPDVEHAGGRHHVGHGLPRAADRASRCRPRARPARPTTTTTPGSSASRRISSTGVWVGFDQPKTIISNGYAADVAVPIWAGFMKRATKGDKPEWLDKPANVVAVNVCRMSGKLPGAGCESVQVVTKDGQLETRSMIYTRVLRHAARSRPTSARCTTRRRSSIGWPASSARTTTDAGRRRRGGSADAAADEHRAAPPARPR